MAELPSLVYDPGLEPRPVRVSLVWGMGLPGCPPTESAPPYLHEILLKVRTVGESFIPAARKAAVRNMLRFGSYKPSGRSKPSSEYLLSTALQSSFPLVNPAVDANNAVSLEYGYPASIFDLDLCGPQLLCRRGRAGESYVFNAAGQTIDLKDLLCVCRVERDGWVPCGNPVKDAMETKTRESTRNVVAVIFAPAIDPIEVLTAASNRFVTLLKEYCGAMECGWSLPE